MSEEAKVRLVDKATDNVSSGKKIESREEKGSVKHWKLGSYNSDADRDLYRRIVWLIETQWNIHSCSVARSRSRVFSSTSRFSLFFSVRVNVALFLTSFKKNQATEKLSLRFESIAGVTVVGWKGGRKEGRKEGMNSNSNTILYCALLSKGKYWSKYN